MNGSLRGVVAVAGLVACVCAAAAASAGEPVYRRVGDDGLTEFTNRPLEGTERVIVLAYQPTYDRAGTAFGARLVRRVDAVIDALIVAAATTHRIEPALLRAVIAIESGFDPRARSSAGAIGLMQLMPQTALRYGVVDARDPAQNIDAGTRHLKDLMARFDGDMRLTLAAYNAGEAAVVRNGLRVPPYPETQAYVPAVLARYAREQKRGTAVSLP
jgi:soluble lytic murein transglycosylase-like protein